MNNEHYCLVWEDAYGKLKVVETCPPPEGSIKLYTHPVKELTDEDIAKVVHELNQKANTPERWVTAMQIGAETIIQLRDELAILRKAQE